MAADEKEKTARLDCFESIISRPPSSAADQHSPYATAFRDHYRYFLLFVVCMAVTAVSSNMLTLKFTTTCVFGCNATRSSGAPVFCYSTKEKAVLLAAPAAGSLIGFPPLHFAVSRYGARYVFFVCGLLSAAATALIPLVASATLGVGFITLRCVQGAVFSPTFDVVGLVVAHWSSRTQKAFFISVLTCYSSLSVLITSGVSGVVRFYFWLLLEIVEIMSELQICDSIGWPFVYYLHAAVSAVIFCSLWLAFYSDRPEMSRFVSASELEAIQDSGTARLSRSSPSAAADTGVPYKVCRCKPTNIDSS